MTPPDLGYLRALLNFLAGTNEPELTSDGEEVVIHRGTVRSHISLYRGEGDTWAITATVSSWSTRDNPPDVDVLDIEPPQPWAPACRALLQHLLKDDIEGYDNALADAETLPEIEEPYNPEGGWDNSTGQE